MRQPVGTPPLLRQVRQSIDKREAGLALHDMRASDSKKATPIFVEILVLRHPSSCWRKRIEVLGCCKLCARQICLPASAQD